MHAADCFPRGGVVLLVRCLFIMWAALVHHFGGHAAQLLVKLAILQIDDLMWGIGHRALLFHQAGRGGGSHG